MKTRSLAVVPVLGLLLSLGLPALAIAHGDEPHGDHDAQHGAHNHRARECEEACREGLLRHPPPYVEAGERPDHEHVAVREVDEAQHAINHRVAQRDERVDRAEREAVDELLEELGQKS